MLKTEEQDCCQDASDKINDFTHLNSKFSVFSFYNLLFFSLYPDIYIYIYSAKFKFIMISITAPYIEFILFFLHFPFIIIPPLYKLKDCLYSFFFSKTCFLIE
jgi:hypothetical protein